MNIAVAIVHAAKKLLVLDEPTTGFDIESRYEIWDLIGEITATGNDNLILTDPISSMKHSVSVNVSEF